MLRQVFYINLLRLIPPEQQPHVNKPSGAASAFPSVGWENQCSLRGQRLIKKTHDEALKETMMCRKFCWAAVGSPPIARGVWVGAKFDEHQNHLPQLQTPSNTTLTGMLLHVTTKSFES